MLRVSRPVQGQATWMTFANGLQKTNLEQLVSILIHCWNSPVHFQLPVLQVCLALNFLLATTSCRNVLAWISRGHPYIPIDTANPNKLGNHPLPCVCSGMR